VSWFRNVALAGTLGVLAACGPGSGTTPSATVTPRATPTPTAAPTHPLEFAVLLLASSQNGSATDQLTIYDPTGGAHGQATFQAPTPPMVGNAAAVTQIPAFTAAGAAYYADQTGSISRLRPDSGAGGSPVAGFPFGNAQQQELSFAVSPDGQRVFGIITQLPPLMTNCNGPCGFQPGAITVKVVSATAGGPAVTLVQRTIAQDQFFMGQPRLFAWNASGPVQLDDAATGTQDGIPGYEYGPWGHAHYLMSNGQPGQAVAGSSCAIDDLAANGTAVCEPPAATPPNFGGPHPVVNGAGTTLFSVTPAPVSCAACKVDQIVNVRISPDGTRVALAETQSPSGSNSMAKSELLDATGSLIPLPDNFQAEGWLDDQTLIGTTSGSLNAGTGQGTCPNGDLPGNAALSLVKLSDPSHAVPFNQCGVFVGVVRPPS
jgi:hypothetical protein